MGIYLLSFLTSTNIVSTKQNWEVYSQQLIGNADINAAHLFEVSQPAKEENPVDFQLVSVVECEDTGSYEAARKNLLIQKVDLTGIMGEDVFAKTEYTHGNQQFDTDKIVLISPIRVTNEQVDSFRNHWFSANEVMIKKEGFRGVNFLKPLDGHYTSQVKFINVAEWESLDHIHKALAGEDYRSFRENAQQFRNGLAPALCKHVYTIKPTF